MSTRTGLAAAALLTGTACANVWGIHDLSGGSEVTTDGGAEAASSSSGGLSSSSSSSSSSGSRSSSSGVSGSSSSGSGSSSTSSSGGSASSSGSNSSSSGSSSSSSGGSSSSSSGGSQTINALWTQAADGTVQVPNSSAFNVTTSATMEAWFYLVGYGGKVILNKWTSGLEDKLIGFVDGTQEPPSGWYFYVGEPAQGPGRVDASSTPNLQAWHHVALVLGSGTLTIYLDGTAMGSSAYGASIGNSTGPLSIGAVNRGGSWLPPVNGYLAEVRLSNTAKYSSNFTPARSLTAGADTIGLWHLNEGSGTVAHDSGPNGLTGTIMGNAQWVVAPAIP